MVIFVKDFERGKVKQLSKVYRRREITSIYEEYFKSRELGKRSFHCLNSGPSRASQEQEARGMGGWGR